MKIVVSKSNLLNGIQSVQNIVSSRINLPILTNILIETYDNQLRLVATDLDIGISCLIPVNISEQGGITVPAKRFADIIKELPDGQVTIAVKKNDMVDIECLNCHFKIMGVPREEFPKLPEFKDKEAVSIDQTQLKDMLYLTSFAVSHEESRYILNGILFELKNNVLKLVATDGRRLAFTEKRLPKETKKEIRAIVPIKAVQEVLRNLKDEGELSIVVSENQILFGINNVLIVSRIIEGEFPNYGQVIPKPSEKKMVVDREQFLASIRRANLLSTPDSQAIKFEIFPARGGSSTEGKITISKTTPDIGEHREELSIQYEGKELMIGFNPHYLIDVLKNLKQSEIGLEFTESDKPGVIRLEDYIYLVLPMKI
ncbi:MAG: DNA polymerase III subunit beta [Candidatus Omnitrophica bacterium]|nr:DNA polymerase III subunit beta [Candidatus Omnitrophota bacterium]HOX54915.1 DNA polymerase III subunit beta [Candidatus Omnitrophota bacterium]